MFFSLDFNLGYFCGAIFVEGHNKNVPSIVGNDDTWYIFGTKDGGYIKGPFATNYNFLGCFKG